MSIKFTDAIYAATRDAMLDPAIHVMGLGATYPNGLDGTMKDLATQYPDRVHDMPCSENAITGMAVGAAVSGLRPIVHHGRIEFSLHAADQILTQAAKWNYMFGGDYPCPLTLRIAMGRQWGNGPQHTMINMAMFAVPGLTVVCPSTPDAAYWLFRGAVEQDSPVIFLESRWLYKTSGSISPTPQALDKCRILRTGSDITIVAVADAVIDALKAAAVLQKHGISAEVIDLVSVYPIDTETIHQSRRKTGRVLAVSYSTPTYSAASEIIASAGMSCIFDAHSMLTCMDTPCPTAPSLTADYYPTYWDIAVKAAAILNVKIAPGTLSFNELNLPPTDNFDSLL